MDVGLLGSRALGFEAVGNKGLRAFGPQYLFDTWVI